MFGVSIWQWLLGFLAAYGAISLRQDITARIALWRERRALKREWSVPVMTSGYPISSHGLRMYHRDVETGEWIPGDTP